MEARQEIEILVMEFAWCVDHSGYDRIPALFTEEGVFENPRGRLAGQKELTEGLKKRGEKTATTRHVVTNLRLEQETPDRIRGWASFALYSHEGEGFGLPDPAAIGEYQDIYERGNDQRWRIAERLTKPIFVRPGALE